MGIPESYSPVMDDIINLLKKYGLNDWWRINITVFQRLNIDNQKYRQLHKLINNMSIVIPLILSTILVLNKLISELISIFFIKKCGVRSDGQNVLFVTHNRWTWKSDSETGNKKLSFDYYDSIRRLFPQNVDVTYIQDGLFGINYIKLFDVIRYGSYPITTLVKYTTFNHLRLIFKSYPGLKLICKYIEDDDSIGLRKLSDTVGKDIVDVKNDLKISILTNYLSTIIHDDVVKHCLTERRANCVVLISEQSEFGRSWVKTSNEHRIATFGLQHGILEHIGEGINLPYCCIRIPNRDDRVMYPIPDNMLVYGLNDKEYLISTLNYPEDKIEVTGNPRYDILYNIHNRYSRMDFCKKHSLDSSSKIVLWIMQMIGFSKEENELYLNEVLSVISSTPDIILIMKRHPADSESHMTLIQDFILKYGVEDRVIIPKVNEDTTELIYISDIIINKHSTAGQEVVALKKPMLILDFTSDIKLNPYVLGGVGIPLSSQGMLKEVLNNLFIFLDQISDEQQTSYIKNHLYRIDGLSSQRVVDTIMQHIKTSNN